MARILVVEDDPIDRRPLTRLLEREGYEVTGAGDATTALAAMLNMPPDLILLDVGIPRMDGLTLLWRLREMPGMRQTPVIIITGHDAPETATKARELGASEYLVKSQFKPEELMRLVRLYTLPDTVGSSAVSPAHSPEN